jgi:hypothetical protein
MKPSLRQTINAIKGYLALMGYEVHRTRRMNERGERLWQAPPVMSPRGLRAAKMIGSGMTIISSASPVLTFFNRLPRPCRRPHRRGTHTHHLITNHSCWLIAPDTTRRHASSRARRKIRMRTAYFLKDAPK